MADPQKADLPGFDPLVSSPHHARQRLHGLIVDATGVPLGPTAVVERLEDALWTWLSSPPRSS